MTPTPPSTTSSSAGGHSPDTQYRVVRKRNRVPLSCGPCRHRKLKCNRSHPCENCIRRGDAASCTFAAPGTRKKSQLQGATSPDDMQNRIDRLEGLVLSLMTNGAQSAGPAAASSAIARSQSDSAGSFHQDLSPEDNDMIKEEGPDEDSDVDGVANSLGTLKVDADKGKSLYYGDSHWHLVMEDIAEVRNYFTSHKKEMESNYEKIKKSKPSAALAGPVFLFGGRSTVADEDLRAELPPKTAVDKLVTRYFNSYDPSVHILHSPTFHKELHAHWKNPSETSIIWLGLLYAILCLAMQSYHRYGDEPLEWKGRTAEMAAEYRQRTVQCLVNSDYTKSTSYSLETLLLYVHGEYASSWDAEVGIWIIIGIVVRLSIRMGYHRDPSNYPNLTPYQGEFRRRVWAFIRQMDTLFSFQLSLPGMIRNTDTDTSIPRNIFEDEFGPETKVLPPARPASEPTPVSYLITKAQICFEFGSTLEEINSVNGKLISYDDILKRDNRLRDIRKNMAPHLQPRPLEESIHDPAALLIQRFSINILWHKTMCVLHRKYITRARHNPRYIYSRRASVDASMEILHSQAQLHRESQPGGRLRTMKWYISSLTISDYLLAAMIVCVDLHYDAVAETMPEPPANYDPYFWTPAQRADMLAALETSLRIWEETADTSLEAYKASNLIKLVLDKLKAGTQASTERRTTSEEAAQENLRPEHSAAMTLGMMSGGLSPNSAAMFNALSQSPRGTPYGNFDASMGDPSSHTGLTPNSQDFFSNPFASLNQAASPFSVFNNAGTGIGMMDVPANLDWEAWDSYLQAGVPMDQSFQYYGPIEQTQMDPEGQQPAEKTVFGSSVFMGANTPGR